MAKCFVPVTPVRRFAQLGETAGHTRPTSNLTVMSTVELRSAGATRNFWTHAIGVVRSDLDDVNVRGLGDTRQASRTVASP